MLDINNHTPRIIKYVGETERQILENSPRKNGYIQGCTYKLQRIEIFDSYSLVYLENDPLGYNSILFTEVKTQNENK